MSGRLLGLASRELKLIPHLVTAYLAHSSDGLRHVTFMKEVDFAVSTSTVFASLDLWEL